MFNFLKTKYFLVLFVSALLFACKDKNKEAYEALKTREFYAYPAELYFDSIMNVNEIDSFTRALKYKKEQWMLRYLSSLYFEIGDYENSITSYNAYAKDYQLDGFDYFYKGLCEYKLKHDSIARSDLTLSKKIITKYKNDTYKEGVFSDYDFADITKYENYIDTIDTTLKRLDCNQLQTK